MVNKIWYNYHSSEGRIIFYCKQESVYGYLSRCIDKLNSILNNKICISIIVNKVKERDCELNVHQTILVINWTQYLKQAYLFMLQKDSSNNIKTFTSSVKKQLSIRKKLIKSFSEIKMMIKNWRHQLYCKTIGKYIRNELIHII